VSERQVEVRSSTGAGTWRDHHIEAFTMWMSGGGFKPGITIGQTDELGYYCTQDRVHVHDLQATLLYQLGLDHLKLTYRFQGRDFRLTDVGGNVVHPLLTWRRPQPGQRTVA
jgi:hypothetical protein